LALDDSSLAIAIDTRVHTHNYLSLSYYITFFSPHCLLATNNNKQNLIAQQAEVIDNIEDDVEAAHGDVKAGQEEITILYSIKKGNRALILKVFGLIIFLIVFLRFYG
jgi:SNARE domain